MILHRFACVRSVYCTSHIPAAEALKLREWRREHETSAEYSSRGQKPWANIPVAEQFFSVFVRLQLGLGGQELIEWVYQKERFPTKRNFLGTRADSIVSVAKSETN